MSRAADILRKCHTKGQARRAAQSHCAGMVHFCRERREVFQFNDGSTITVTDNKVSFSNA